MEYLPNFTYLTQDYYDGFINDRVKYGSGKNGEIAQNPPHFPVAFLPVSNLSASKFQNFVSGVNFLI